ncbi:unnamed protein product [Mytilus coruscus]|uniref:Integrase catalytic domain-containing protein n=1 Tax=Mytilus coruscus TaxID=42192 RepID=A0A6J8EP71_MYTCO|nr:unnamed protein product [Mytilus coruscus]
MKSITARKTIDIMRQVFARNGVPAHILSDNGPSFVSAEFAEFLRQNEIKHTKSAPYHPATNGLVERFIQTFKQSMKAIQFEVGERVIAEDYRGKDPWVAGIISEREGPLMYKVSTDNGHTWRRHTEQLKSTQMPKSYEQSIENDNIIVDNTETRTQQHVAEKSPEQNKSDEMTMPRRNPIRERNPTKRLIAKME